MSKFRNKNLNLNLLFPYLFKVEDTDLMQFSTAVGASDERFKFEYIVLSRLKLVFFY